MTPWVRTFLCANVGAFALLAVDDGARAEPCTRDSVATLPGRWITGKPDRRFQALPKHDVEVASALIGGIDAAVRTAVPWQPVGGEVLAGGVDFYDVRAGGNPLPHSLLPLAQPFGTTFAMMPYICKSDGTWYVLHEFDTSLTVRLNSVWLHNSDDLTTSDAEGTHEESFLLPDLAPTAGRTWDIVLGDQRATDSARKVYRLVAREGRFPLVPMTKAEYYRERIRALQQEKAPESTGMAEMDRFNRSLNATADEIIARFEHLLTARTAGELASPALSSEQMGDFVQRPADVPEERRAGALYVFRWDRAYFRRLPSRLTPQFATIVYQQYRGDPQEMRTEAPVAFFRELERGNALDVVTRELLRAVPP